MSEPEVLHEWSLNENYRLRIEGNDDGVTKTRLRFRYKDGPWQPDPGAQYVLMDEIATLAATVKELREEREQLAQEIRIALTDQHAHYLKRPAIFLGMILSRLASPSVPTVSAEEE